MTFDSTLKKLICSLAVMATAACAYAISCQGDIGALSLITTVQVPDPIYRPVTLSDKLEYPINEGMAPDLPDKPEQPFSESEPAQPEQPAGNSFAPEELSLASYWLKTKLRLYHPIIIAAAHRHEIDPALVKAIIMAESGYNANAISKSGAKGLMQLMPGTAKALGVEDIFDPAHNINGGVRYFKRLVNIYNGDLRLALAAYNAGIQKVNHYQGIPPYKATRFYIKKVFRYYEYFKSKTASDTERA